MKSMSFFDEPQVKHVQSKWVELIFFVFLGSFIFEIMRISKDVLFFCVIIREVCKYTNLMHKYTLRVYIFI